MIDTAIHRMFDAMMKANPQLGGAGVGILISKLINAQQVFHTDDGFALFIRLDTESLARVKDNVNLLINPATVAEFLYGNGQNLHIIGVYAYNKNKILPWLRVFIKHYKPESVSWYNRTLKFRRVECLSQ